MSEFNRTLSEKYWREWPERLSEEEVLRMADAEEYDWLLEDLLELGGSLERVPYGVLGLLQRVRELVTPSKVQ